MSKFIVLGLDELNVVHEVGLSSSGVSTDESSQVLGTYLATFNEKEQATHWIKHRLILIEKRTPGRYEYEHGYTIIEIWD